MTERSGRRTEPRARVWLDRRRQVALLALGVILLLAGLALTVRNGNEPTAIIAGAIALIGIGLLGDLVDEVAIGPVTARRRRDVLGDVAAEAQAGDPAVGRAVERVAEIAEAKTPRELDEAGAAAKAQLLALRAEDWVMEQERDAGRSPRRPGAERPAVDIESPPRMIGVRVLSGRTADATDLEVSEQERAVLTHLYVVEAADPADRTTWRLRIHALDGPGTAA